MENTRSQENSLSGQKKTIICSKFQDDRRKPDITKLSNGDLSDQTQAEAYGFSCFDGTDGIISLRNPSANADKTIKFTFDRTMGVAEGAGTLNYYLEHSYLLSDKSAQTGTLKYGQEYTVNLKPNEVRILRVSAEKTQQRRRSTES